MWQEVKGLQLESFLQRGSVQRRTLSALSAYYLSPAAFFMTAEGQYHRLSSQCLPRWVGLRLLTLVRSTSVVDVLRLESSPRNVIKTVTEHWVQECRIDLILIWRVRGDTSWVSICLPDSGASHQKKKDGKKWSELLKNILGDAELIVMSFCTDVSQHLEPLPAHLELLVVPSEAVYLWNIPQPRRVLLTSPVS